MKNLQILIATISSKIPNETAFFRVPHHGSTNGSFDGSTPVWLNDCPSNAILGINCHVGHPHQKVIDLFKNRGRKYIRTDQHYHLVFETDGLKTNTFYLH